MFLSCNPDRGVRRSARGMHVHENKVEPIGTRIVCSSVACNAERMKGDST